ncbi:mannose-1-phosphate guanylyltransferase/mannose-6-phosphate isomerase [Limibaculum sp. M0105]|uniref:mannose-1-phosphate guanylyltransferase n=1 Tax=Thermohalobaculum xanthum TaxID=2753746 RepID=A0A8J7SEG6_9RHOB|nr:mannose-1-phosphate guanylyltransferase/mannose-6-phosphate isomerase [Thermohalobaculum xanthum]MBK0397880.1 mannose-1-phosphate guanylyltransferase/mannose-6-phosphate isomerase [Thermohalobaculum xanthum]
MPHSLRVHPVIMCGGSGTRLWPVSRKAHPKQFTQLLSGGSLFMRTLGRVAGAGYAAPILLTHQDFRFVVAEQLAASGVDGGRIVVEPDGRNTGPAICAAALIIAETDPDALMLVLPSDHVLRDDAAFHRAVEAGSRAAATGALVTFGIRPDRPETGYGYIELSPGAEGEVLDFARFVEKPDAARASEMLASGRYLWNSGMFLFGAGAIIDAFEKHAPAVIAAARGAVAAGREDLDFLRLSAAEYLGSPDISIDYAVMEHVAGKVVPVECGWNDLGNWRTVWQESAPDDAGVVTEGGAIALDCEATLLRSDDPDVRLVGLGLQGIVAVATRDGVLVANMDRAQDVREAVTALTSAGARQATEFPRHYRPWGWYETIGLGDRFQVKQIVVKPGARLSLQSHVHRAEHWVVVAGTARITVDQDVRLLTENQSIYVPLGAVHRLENPGKVELRLIEVQSGVYLGEDDIVRYEDDYARG